MKRAAIYTRKSTSSGLDQAFSSLDAQRDACAAYVARQEGWSLSEARYDDGGFTGANLERPAFQRLLADVAAKKVDVVVVYKVDRLSRSLLDFARLMAQLNEHGVSFVSVTQNFSTADAMGRLTLNMLMSFAEFEREMIAERTRDKIRATRARGDWSGGTTPFGYRVIDRRLVPEDGEADTVRELFALFLETRSLSETARRLNAAGLYPRARRSKHGPGWSKVTVGTVLRSPLYAGRLRVGGALVRGNHLPLVESDAWDEVAALLASGRYAGRERAAAMGFPLRGRARCGACDSALVPARTRKGAKIYRYYRCAGRDRHGACTGRGFPAEALESFVAEQARVQIEDLPGPVRVVRVFEGDGRAEVELGGTS